MTLANAPEIATIGLIILVLGRFIARVPVDVTVEADAKDTIKKKD
jgi:hypothetical protein